MTRQQKYQKIIPFLEQTGYSIYTVPLMYLNTNIYIIGPSSLKPILIKSGQHSYYSAFDLYNFIENHDWLPMYTENDIDNIMARFNESGYLLHNNRTGINIMSNIFQYMEDYLKSHQYNYQTLLKDVQFSTLCDKIPVK